MFGACITCCKALHCAWQLQLQLKCFVEINAFIAELQKDQRVVQLRGQCMFTARLGAYLAMMLENLHCAVSKTSQCRCWVRAIEVLGVGTGFMCMPVAHAVMYTICNMPGSSELAWLRRVCHQLPHFGSACPPHSFTHHSLTSLIMSLTLPKHMHGFPCNVQLVSRSRCSSNSAGLSATVSKAADLVCRPAGQ